MLDRNAFCFKYFGAFDLARENLTVMGYDCLFAYGVILFLNEMVLDFEDKRDLFTLSFVLTRFFKSSILYNYNLKHRVHHCRKAKAFTCGVGFRIRFPPCV